MIYDFISRDINHAKVFVMVVKIYLKGEFIENPLALSLSSVLDKLLRHASVVGLYLYEINSALVS